MLNIEEIPISNYVRNRLSRNYRIQISSTDNNYARTEDTRFNQL